MSTYKIEKRKLRVDEYQSLRNSTGWNPIDDATVKIALERDLFSVCILDENQTIGIGRVVGDGAIYFYIQDIIVLPQYQNKGIGRMIMNQIESYLNFAARNNSFIGLMAAEGLKEFYEKFNFIERPTNRPGMFKIIRR